MTEHSSERYEPLRRNNLHILLPLSRTERYGIGLRLRVSPTNVSPVSFYPKYDTSGKREEFL